MENRTGESTMNGGVHNYGETWNYRCQQTHYHLDVTLSQTPY